MIVGLLVGKCVGLTGLGCFAAYALLIPTLRRRAVPEAVPLGLALIVPALVKRVAGDGPPLSELRGPALRLTRLLLDADEPGGVAGRVLGRLRARTTIERPVGVLAPNHPM